MGLWHEKLIPILPKYWLLGQHRECCSLRGIGWTEKNKAYDYVRQYDFERIVAYHMLILKELSNKGYVINEAWLKASYRGKQLDSDYTVDMHKVLKYKKLGVIYPEHTNDYLIDCVAKLKRKGVEIGVEFSSEGIKVTRLGADDTMETEVEE